MNDGESWLPRTLRGMEIDRRVEVSIRQWPRGDRALATHGNTSAVAARRVIVPGCAALRPSMGTLGGQRSIEGLGLLRWESWLDSLRSWGILFCLWDLVGLIALLTLDSMYHRWVSGLVCSLEFCKCVCVYVYVCLCVLGSFMFVSVSVFAVCFWLPVCVCARKYILIFLPQWIAAKV